MGNSLRCCLACVLPCGALDLIRIVHLNGHVDVIDRPTTAGEILQANPGHVLSKPSSETADVRRILVLSPDDELKRGSIYFLIPDQAVNDHHHRHRHLQNRSPPENNNDGEICYDFVVLPDKKPKSSRRRNRRSRGQISSSVPRLESICEC